MEIKGIKNKANSIFYERSSIRKYDKSVKISKEELTNILQDAMTAPSSLNLQPWRFVIFHTEEAKAFLQPYMMFNQVQGETAGAVIAIFGDLDNFSDADKIWSAAAEHGLMPKEAASNMITTIKEYGKSKSKEQFRDTVLSDCGLVTMQLMLSAKAYGYDSNPIGGYKKNELTEALGMDTKRYIPVMLVTIGKADEPAHESIRFSVDEITRWK